MTKGAARLPDDYAGLTLRKGGRGWMVVHSSSGLDMPDRPAFRLKRDAAGMRADLLASGVDFTRPPEAFRGDPVAARVVREITGKWREAGGTPEPSSCYGPVMMHYCSRNSDGTIHVTNAIGGMTGQHHVHDDEGFARWRQGGPLGRVADSAIYWFGEDTADCTCGQPVNGFPP